MSPELEASTSTSHLRSPTSSYRDEPADEDDGDVFDPYSIDPAYRLRTTRTAHSVIAESIRSEAAAEGRKKRRLFASMRRKGPGKGNLNLRDSLRVKSGSIVKAASIKSRARSSTITTIGTEAGGTSPQQTVAPPIPPPVSAPVEPTPPKAKKTLSQRIHDWTTPTLRPATRRQVYINLPLPAHMLKSGEPIMRYVRNKVRTSKYTLITFLPKNLFEQFRRVANIYFLAAVILQLFSIFGAPNAQIGMLPLLFILGMTAIKDGIEDWRRATLDNEVNNSATTKLTGWRNVNQPSDPRAWFEKLLGMGQGMRAGKYMFADSSTWQDVKRGAEVA